MKKLLLATAALLLSGAAYAGNVPLLGASGWDPTNGLGSLNALVQSIDANTGGSAAVLPAPVTTGGTTIETDFAYTVPANALVTGQALRIHAAGANSADANAKTITFSFGGQTCAVIVTGSGNNWFADFTVVETGSKTQTYECHGLTNVTPVTVAQNTNWTIDNTAAISVLVRQTAATSGTMTLNMANVEYVR